MNNSQTPVLIERDCGGWLALAPAASPVRIAVTAADEAPARESLRASLEEWDRLLAAASVPSNV
jgi:hypothetical protein